MARVVISEYSKVASFGSVPSPMQAGQEPAVVEQVVDTATATLSQPFSKSTSFIRLQTNAKVHFRFGEDPTADTGDKWLAPDGVEYFGVYPGHKISLAPG